VPIIVAINKIDKPTPMRRRSAPTFCSTKCSWKAWAVKSSTSRFRRSSTQPRQAARRDPAAGRTARPEGQPRPHRRRCRDRGQARQGPRFGRHRAGSPARSSRRHRRCRRPVGPCARAGQRPGEHVKEAGPALPVEILGLEGTPQAGDRFAVVESEARAREITEYRQRKLPATRWCTGRAERAVRSNR
jgi:hypothetical protein